MKTKTYLIKMMAVFCCTITSFTTVFADFICADVSPTNASAIVDDILREFPNHSGVVLSHQEIYDYLMEQLSGGVIQSQLESPSAVYYPGDKYWHGFTWAPVVETNITYGSAAVNLAVQGHREPFEMNADAARRFDKTKVKPSDIWLYSFYTMSNSSRRSHLYIIIVEKDVSFNCDPLQAGKLIHSEKGNQDIEILNAFPNPVSDQLTIPFRLKEEERLSIRLTNVAGQELKGFGTQDFYKKGHHRIHLNLATLVSGYYFLELRTDEFIARQKIIKTP